MSLSALFVEGGVAGVEVFAVEAILGGVEGFGEALIVDDLALAEELEGIADVGIVDHAEEVIIGHARLLLCYYHVFATKSCLLKVRKILIFQGLSALLELPIF